MLNNITNRPYARLALFGTLLTFVVIVLGAYTRLSDAGLGCPDWPVCYGKWMVPEVSSLPEYPLIDTTKAWIEMIHRYAASFLGLVIVLLAGFSFFNRRKPESPFWLPMSLVILVIFQGLLGMWTVTLKLFPIVVMAHLLGGMTTLAGIWWLTLRLYNPSIQHAQDTLINNASSLKRLAIFGLMILIVQMALGAWTSANYAALVCPDFPFCQGTALNSMPPLYFSKAFDFFQASLSLEARITIHVLHRLGALLTASILGCLVILCFKHHFKLLSIVIAFLLILQIILGIINIWALLPLAIAVAHNAIAALLLLALITLNHQLKFKT